MKPASLRSLVVVAAVLALAACGLERRPPQTFEDPPFETAQDEQAGLLFGGPIQLLGGDRETSGAGLGIGVNTFLWRASLETIDFMPLVSADPFGG
ncbi:MAG: DUF3576 domain-containing protein, partial [Geminicoccaceae bacterium]